MAEIPLVVVDAQRSGPRPVCRPSRSKGSQPFGYGVMVIFPRNFALARETPEQCFYLTVKACNLAKCTKYRSLCPGPGALTESCHHRPDRSEPGRHQSGKRLDTESLAELPVYKRYAFSDDGVSAFATRARLAGCRSSPGKEHDEFGQVSTDPGNRSRMMHKRQIKVQAMQPDLPRPLLRCQNSGNRLYRNRDDHGVILEAQEILAERGFSVQYHQPQTLWPMLEGKAGPFSRDCRCVFVVEYNATAQLAKLIVAHGGENAHIESILVFDGVPLRAEDLVQKVIERLDTRGEKVA
ncbi:MAG: hypothetical protein Ct9H300mP16_15960 [Pseudomonadota bacterium]|nr:MAG: hypothetical protein Ct9H300mP16_15960 [Pseudomonadota bacterium]